MTEELSAAEANAVALAAKIEALSQACEKAQSKADRASEVAMTAIETTKHLEVALQKAHDQQNEMLAAIRKMTMLAESLANVALGVK